MYEYDYSGYYEDNYIDYDEKWLEEIYNQYKDMEDGYNDLCAEY